MKKFLKTVGDFFSTLLACLIAILLGIFLIIWTPIDYIKYKRSRYYKQERKKYTLLAGMSVYFDMYNEIAENALPIQYIHNLNDDSLDSGWFVFEDTLIIPNVYSFEYGTETEMWSCNVDDDEEKREIISLDTYIDTEIQIANQEAGRIICSKAVVLIDADCLNDVQRAKMENRFLICDNDRTEVLANFCKKSIDVQPSE